MDRSSSAIIEEDFAKLGRDLHSIYQDRWRADTDDKPDYTGSSSSHVLDPDRSLGSVIQLLTPQPDYSDEYNGLAEDDSRACLRVGVDHQTIFKPGMEQNWKRHFGVDIVNGSPGHELKLDNVRWSVLTCVSAWTKSHWRTFKLRQDFIAAAKVQREDDISCSVVVPARAIGDVGPAMLPAAATSLSRTANIDCSNVPMMPSIAAWTSKPNSIFRSPVTSSAISSRCRPTTSREIV